MFLNTSRFILIPPPPSPLKFIMFLESAFSMNAQERALKEKVGVFLFDLESSEGDSDNFMRVRNVKDSTGITFRGLIRVRIEELKCCYQL